MIFNKYFNHDFSSNLIPFDFRKFPRAFFESSFILEYPTNVFLHFSNHFSVTSNLLKSIGQFWGKKLLLNHTIKYLLMNKPLNLHK
jgi:hypothetical protein